MEKEQAMLWGMGLELGKRLAGVMLLGLERVLRMVKERELVLVWVLAGGFGCFVCKCMLRRRLFQLRLLRLV